MAFRCNVVIHFFDNALKVAVKEESCEECGASQVEVGFKVNTTESPDVCQGHSHHTIVRVGLTFAVPHFYVDAEHHVYLPFIPLLF